MQNQNDNTISAVNGAGKIISMVTTTPHCDAILINDKAPRLSVEYAKCRTAINEDFKLMFASNQALAKRQRSESKHRIVAHLKGEVSRNKEGDLIVTFPDTSVARL